MLQLPSGILPMHNIEQYQDHSLAVHIDIENNWHIGQHSNLHTLLPLPELVVGLESLCLSPRKPILLHWFEAEAEAEEVGVRLKVHCSCCGELLAYWKKINVL